MGLRLGQFLLQGLVPLLKFRKMSLQRHVQPPSWLDQPWKCAMKIAVCRRQRGRVRTGSNTSLGCADCLFYSVDNDNLPGGRNNVGWMMGDRLSEEDLAKLSAELKRLREEHRDLDNAIEALERLGVPDQLQVQRLKKRKLVLKDRMRAIENLLTPDIIA
jgi:hypothetical protein